MCETRELPPVQCAALSRGAGRTRDYHLRTCFPLKRSRRIASARTGTADGIERALGGAHQVRFDVGVFLGHRNDRFALRGKLELPATVRVALATARDPLLEQALRVTVQKANRERVRAGSRRKSPRCRARSRTSLGGLARAPPAWPPRPQGARGSRSWDTRGSTDGRFGNSALNLSKGVRLREDAVDSHQVDAARLRGGWQQWQAFGEVAAPAKVSDRDRREGPRVPPRSMNVPGSSCPSLR